MRENAAVHVLEDIAGRVVAHPRGAVDEATREAASLLVADLMAATSAGLQSNLAKAARHGARMIYGAGDASFWFAGGTTTVAGAAVANAAAASALDIDDGHRGAAGHAGAGIIPAVLAIAEAAGTADEDVFDALVLGYEVALRVASSRQTRTIETYSSGRWVGYGVAAAAGRLLGLDAPALASAMAIAGAEGPISFPIGTSRYQGSTVKEGIPPAVQAGLMGAYRAQGGATGPIDLLDDEARFDRAVMLGPWGERWWIRDCYTKPYACCRYMHAAVDAILALRQEGQPVHALRIETFPAGLRLANERAPRTLEGGQYSYYFSCAVAALHGEAALQPVDPARLREEVVIELASRIELVAHDDFVDSFPKGTPCRVVLDQGDGPWEMTVLHPLGDVANPMSREQTIAKLDRIGAANLDTPRRAVLRAALDAVATAGFSPLLAAIGSTRDHEVQHRRRAS